MEMGNDVEDNSSMVRQKIPGFLYPRLPSQLHIPQDRAIFRRVIVNLESIFCRVEEHPYKRKLHELRIH